ncbi:MAG: hypothetical protein KJZ86_12415 [Caldilineaceae bacterium]|nr:hypothetical protein [Caldilineaceae bacterium]HRJ40751.1 hypothetical protein [Caldilineaceae bacterium]
MPTLTLSPELHEPLKRLAAGRDTSVEDVVESLVADYLRQQWHEALLLEMDRYRLMHPQIATRYYGQFLGIQDGKILDTDPDGGVLHKRLRQRYGDLPILIVQVTATPEQEFRSFHRHVEYDSV